MIYRKNIILVSTTALILFIAGCEREEIHRTTSPDGIYDAVILRGDGGATGYSYCIYVTKQGQQSSYGEYVCAGGGGGPVGGRGFDSVNARWAGNNILIIEYDGGEISHFKSYWGSAKKVDGQTVHAVEIKLVQPFAKKILINSDSFKLK